MWLVINRCVDYSHWVWKSENIKYWIVSKLLNEWMVKSRIMPERFISMKKVKDDKMLERRQAVVSWWSLCEAGVCILM